MNHRNKVIFLNLIQPLKNHSLSTECIFKPAKNWTYGFQTSCEAYVYYYPYNEAIPTKCVSQPDEDAVKLAINTYWTTLNTSTTISEVAKTLNDEDNLIWQNLSSQETCSSSDWKCKVYHEIDNMMTNSHISRLHTVNTLMDLYGGQHSLLHGRCSYSQRDDKIHIDTEFNSSDHIIFDRQQCEGVI